MENGVCHQYKIRQKTLQEDLDAGFPTNLEPKDFVLSHESYAKEHKKFIERYEWLGNVGQSVGKVFTARWEGKLAGVVIIGAPNAYSFDVKLEALIQRGACASWTPKNLGSMLVMFGCRWMVQNTEKRIFTAYSDPEAGEIGTIYQACNFEYLGNKWGSGKMYFFEGKWKSMRTFTNTWGVHRWAKELGIEWLPEWTISHSGRQNLKTIPKEITKKFREYGKAKANACPIKNQPKKGKYVLLLGKNKKENKKLQTIRTWRKLDYPNVETDSKICFGCKKDLPFTEYTKAKLGKYGLRSKCKSCRALESTIYNSIHKERISVHGKKYRQEKSKQISAQRAIHTHENKERLASYEKACVRPILAK